ncbi:uncharacterized protein LOC133892087 [Phragmites australis]|uniref:uncharacterized protein LOC133892087 n=1 Tax=Phragmites australis TaxID=29695 RepID=UPI002D797EA3|nr:uncharacterized protein LOC133892087 [Phragmites australis]
MPLACGEEEHDGMANAAFGPGDHDPGAIVAVQGLARAEERVVDPGREADVGPDNNKEAYHRECQHPSWLRLHKLDMAETGARRFSLRLSTHPRGTGTAFTGSSPHSMMRVHRASSKHSLQTKF